MRAVVIMADSPNRHAGRSYDPPGAPRWPSVPCFSPSRGCVPGNTARPGRLTAAQGLDGFQTLSRNDISIPGHATRLHVTVPGSLAHLPAIKQRQLQAVMRAIRAAADVEHVILFGSHARGDWVEDFTNGYISDFDILILVANQPLAEDHALWMDCRDRVRCFTADTPVSFIVHTVEDVNQQLARGSSFFRDVVSEGVILHDAGRIALAEVKPLTPEQHVASAQEAFEHYMTRAVQFYGGFEDSLANGRLRIAAFELHQAVEALYKAVLGVFDGYVPKCHDLAELGQRCAIVAPETGMFVPPDAKDGSRLFALIRAAYVDARYSPEFEVSREDVETLGLYVQALQSRIEQVCRVKLA